MERGNHAALQAFCAEWVVSASAMWEESPVVPGGANKDVRPWSLRRGVIVISVRSKELRQCR